MSKVTVYTTSHCPYCVRAKEFLKRKGVAFEEINLEDDPEELNKLKNRTGLRTVPQIFIGEKLIGGFTDMQSLDQKGELDPLLKS
jgi:glutaredoxin 3